MPPAVFESPPKPKSLARLLWVFCGFYIVYGTATPFRFRLDPGYLHQRLQQIDWFPLVHPAGYAIQWFDYIQNVLLFWPFGLFGYVALSDKRSAWKNAALVALGCGLSITVESLQIFSPSRFTALSDVIWNTVGTALGVWSGTRLDRGLKNLRTHAGLRVFLDAEAAYPALIFGIVVLAGAWEPFNFSLDWTAIGYKWHLLLERHWSMKPSSDDLLAFSRYACFTLFSCRLFREARAPGGRVTGAAVAFAIGFLLQLMQFLIQSRMPDPEDTVVLLLGAGLGFGAAFLPPLHRHPRAWIAVLTAGFVTAIGLKELYPFHFTVTAKHFNFIPFLPYYHHASFAALADFMQAVMAYFSIGVITAYLASGRARSLLASLPTALVLSTVIEILQRRLPGRTADVTEILGAVAGILAGHVAITRGWNGYRDYTRRAPEPMRNGDTT